MAWIFVVGTQRDYISFRVRFPFSVPQVKGGTGDTSENNSSRSETILLTVLAVEPRDCMAWWRHQMELFSALLDICAGYSPVPGEFPTQRPVTRSFGDFFDLRLNIGLSKQPGSWWFQTQSHPLCRHCNGILTKELRIDEGLSNK